MSKRQQVEKLLYDLRWQYLGSTVTMGKCNNKDCLSSARSSKGGRTCPDCITKEIGKLIGDNRLAQIYHNDFRRARQVEGKILEKAERK